MSKNKAETSSQLRNKVSNGSKKVLSSSKNEELKKREVSTDRSNLKKSVTAKKVELPPKTVSTSKVAVKNDKINVSSRTSTRNITIKPSKSSTSTTSLNSTKSTMKAPSKGTKSTSRDITSKRVTKEQYFPKKYPFSSYLHENDAKTDKKEAKVGIKTELNKERTVTKVSSPSEKKIEENLVERPRTATIRKHTDVNINENSGATEETVPGNDYEDDFDSYESDFEAYSSEILTSSSSESSFSLNEEKLTELTPKRINSAGNEEERKLDSGNYDLPDVKHKQMLDKIKEAVEKENSNLNQVQSNLASLSDEGFEDGLKNGGFINFTEAKKKQQQKKLVSKSRKRGEDLMGMIRLNNASFSLFDMTAISYDEFMRSYGKSGTIQMSSQTGQDDVDEEIQTENIEILDKSTQFPIRFSPFENNQQFSDNKLTKQLDKFIEKSGELILHILELKQMKKQPINKNERQLPFSDGYFSLKFMENRSVSYMTYSKYSKLLTVHESNIDINMDINSQLLSRPSICIWDISESSCPISILVTSGEITKACFDCNHGFLVFAGICDGSICVWDLREDSDFHRSVYDEKTDKYHVLRSPTYTTVIRVDGEQNAAKIIALQSFSDRLNENTTNQLSFSGIQIATLDETGLIVLWSVIQKSATPELLSDDQGLVPWGCILLVQGLTINLQKLNPNLKELQCFDLQFSEEDSNHFFVASNYGVLHYLTSGLKPNPKIYSTDNSCVNCVEMAPFSSIHFLSGCENGNIKLHSRFYEKPLITLCSEEQNRFEENIQLIEWSNKRPCVFFVKDKSNNIHIWDLTSSDMYPIYSIPFKEEITDIKFLSSNKSSQDCFLAVASKDGVRVHIVSKEFSQISADQYKTELNIFLNYANRL